MGIHSRILTAGFLGERRPLVGQMGLIANQDDLTLEAGVPHCLYGAATRMSGANNDKSFVRHLALPAL